MVSQEFGQGPRGIEPPNTEEVELALGNVVRDGARIQRRNSMALGVAVLLFLVAAVGTTIAIRNKTQSVAPAAHAGTSTTIAATTTSIATSTTVRPIDTPAPAPKATFHLTGDPAEKWINKTYAQMAKAGLEAHQTSYFGTKGQWSLITVVKDGTWFAFTTKNFSSYTDPTSGDVSDYYLDDSSKIVGAQTLAALPKDNWYGVQGVVRNGEPIGGVMMQGVDYNQAADGSFKVAAAWHVNLQTLRLDPTSTKGLAIQESCG